MMNNKLESRDLDESISEIVQIDGRIHYPIIFLIDTSWSMNGKPIESACHWINSFIEFLCMEETITDYVDICIATVDSQLHVYQNFTNYLDVSPISFNAENDRADFINALLEIKRISREYAVKIIHTSESRPPCSPHVFIFSDGNWNEGLSNIEGIIKDLCDRPYGFKWHFYGMLTGDYNIRNMTNCCIPAFKMQDYKDYRIILESVLESSIVGDTPLSLFDLPWWGNPHMESPSKPELHELPIDISDIVDDWL